MCALTPWLQSTACMQSVGRATCGSFLTASTTCSNAAVVLGPVAASATAWNVTCGSGGVCIAIALVSARRGPCWLSSLLLRRSKGSVSAARQWRQAYQTSNLCISAVQARSHCGARYIGFSAVCSTKVASMYSLSDNKTGVAIVGFKVELMSPPPRPHPASPRRRPPPPHPEPTLPRPSSPPPEGVVVSYDADLPGQTLQSFDKTGYIALVAQQSGGGYAVCGARVAANTMHRVSRPAGTPCGVWKADPPPTPHPPPPCRWVQVAPRSPSGLPSYPPHASSLITDVCLAAECTSPPQSPTPQAHRGRRSHSPRD